MFVGRQLDTRPDDKAGLPVAERVMARGDSAESIEPVLGVPERVQVKATLHFEAKAVPTLATLPRDPRTAEQGESDVGPGVHVEPGAQLA